MIYYVGWSVGMSVVSKMRRQDYVAHAHVQSHFWAVKTDLRLPCYSFLHGGRAALAWTKKNSTLINGKLKANRAQRTERLKIRRENKKTENHKKQRMATLKRLKRGDDNELERNLRLDKVVASKQLRLAVETEEERRARLENDAATKWPRLAMEMEKKRKTRLDKMVATAQLMLALIKGIVRVGVVLSLKPILKSWQLCLSFKLDVHRHPQLKEI